LELGTNKIVPDGISRKFRNSQREFATGIQGRVNPGNNRMGIPGGPDCYHSSEKNYVPLLEFGG